MHRYRNSDVETSTQEEPQEGSEYQTFVQAEDNSLTNLRKALEVEYTVAKDTLEKNAQDDFTDSDVEEGFTRFNKSAIDLQLKNLQFQIFKDVEYLEKGKERLKQQKEELYDKMLREKEIEERKLKESSGSINAFHFDFGYLDAKVHELLTMLDSVYPDVVPMPETSSTKSMYSTTKDNLERLGLKVILNRLCVICKYAKPELDTSTNGDFEEEDKSEEDVQDTFIKELTRIRLRTDAVFEKELGAVTGCLLSYPDYVVLMMEGPEISILDILHQGKKLFTELVDDGVVFFIAGQVLVRFIQKDWVDIRVNPPRSTEIFSQNISEDERKPKLYTLSENLQKIWRAAAKAKSENNDPIGYLSQEVPSEKLLEFAISCKVGILRPFDGWYKNATNLTFGDFTSDTWPHVFYPIPFNACKTDSDFDFLGVIDKHPDIPGKNQELEEFLNLRPSWKPRESVFLLEHEELKKLLPGTHRPSGFSDMTKIVNF